MIRNIWAVGRNYADHAKELGNDIPSAPLFFLKAGSCAFWSNEIPLPAWCEDVHHEVEIILYFGEDLSIVKAGLALDLTERKKQNELKAKGSPWTLAKSFSHSCPITKTIPVHSLEELKSLNFELKINGETKQMGSPQDMIFDFASLVEYAKHHFPVEPGDALLTGTPAGVGPLRRGDHVEVQLGTLIHHAWVVV